MLAKTDLAMFLRNKARDEFPLTIRCDQFLANAMNTYTSVRDELICAVMMMWLALDQPLVLRQFEVMSLPKLGPSSIHCRAPYLMHTLVSEMSKRCSCSINQMYVRALTIHYVQLQLEADYGKIQLMSGDRDDVIKQRGMGVPVDHRLAQLFLLLRVPPGTKRVDKMRENDIEITPITDWSSA